MDDIEARLGALEHITEAFMANYLVTLPDAQVQKFVQGVRVIAAIRDEAVADMVIHRTESLLDAVQQMRP